MSAGKDGRNGLFLSEEWTGRVIRQAVKNQIGPARVIDLGEEFKKRIEQRVAKMAANNARLVILDGGSDVA